jgi:hypothetical protein
LDEAFAVPEVQAVVAHTLAKPGPSVRVLEKADFVYDGDVADDDLDTTWRFRISRCAQCASA